MSFVPLELRVQARKLIQARQLLTVMTSLEIASVGESTLIDYVARLLAFCQWAQTTQADWTDAPSLDMSLVTYCDELFWKGAATSDGSKLLASLKLFYFQLAKGGLVLPRTIRVLRSWDKARPAIQRTPFPWLCLCAVVGFLINTNRIPSALALFIQFITYLRPGVLDRLTVSQLIGPACVSTP